MSRNKAAQKKSFGAKDVRYQLKALESASVMDTEDFFAGDFTKQVQPEMLVKPQSSNQSRHVETPKEV